MHSDSRRLCWKVHVKDHWKLETPHKSITHHFPLGPTPAYPLSLRKWPIHLGKHNIQTTKNLAQAISWSLPSMSKTLWNSTPTAFYYSHLRFPTGHLRRMHRRAHCQRCLGELRHSGSCGHLQSAQKVGCDRVIGKTTLEELQSQNRKSKTLKQLYIQ